MKYYKLENGDYIEDESGYLPGMEGVDSHGNNVRIVIHTPDMVGLQYGNCGYVYGVYIKPEGMDKYLKNRDTHANVNDNNYVDENTGLTVPKEEAVDVAEDGTETIKKGYDKQLHFFIQSAKGEQLLPDALYQIMINQVVQDESDLLEGVKF